MCDIPQSSGVTHIPVQIVSPGLLSNSATLPKVALVISQRHILKGGQGSELL
jgi:hypothetical protein